MNGFPVFRKQLFGNVLALEFNFEVRHSWLRFKFDTRLTTHSSGPESAAAAAPVR